MTAARRTELALAAVLAGWGASGCQSSSGVSCNTPALGTCVDWEGVSVTSAQQLSTQCEAEGGTWSTRECPRNTVYLGCKTTQAGATQTQWSTRPVTATQEQYFCPGGMVVTGSLMAPDGGVLGTGGLTGTGGLRGTGGLTGTGGLLGTGGFGMGGSGPTGTGGAGCVGCSVSTIAVEANHLVFDAVRQQLYATVGGAAAAYPNAVAIIDPAAAAVVSSVAAGSDPDYLALSDDASTLWVGLDGAAAVRSFDLTVSPPAAGTSHALPKPTQGLSSIVGGPMVVLPGAPRSVAVNVLYTGSSPEYVGTYILDDGVARPTFVNTFSGPALLTGGPSPYLFGFNNEDTGFEFFTLQVSASGVTATSVQGLLSGFSNAIVYGTGRVLAATGDVIDVSTPATPTRAGRLDFSGAIAPRGANQAVMFSPVSISGTSSVAQLRVLDLTTFTQTASVPIPQITDDTVTDLQVVGADAVAFISYSSYTYPTGTHRIYVIHASVLSSAPASP